MKRIFTRLALAAVGGLLITSSLFAQFNTTGTTTLSVNVGPEGSIQIDTATTNLTNVGTIFNDYTGTTNYTYKIRTTQGSGSGWVKLQVTTDFSPGGGPSVASPPSGGDALTYTCTVQAPGTACAGAQTASFTTQTGVATFGADARSAKAGNATNQVSWILTNDPAYKTGSYQATVTFTISAS